MTEPLDTHVEEAATPTPAPTFPTLWRGLGWSAILGAVALAVGLAYVIAYVIYLSAANPDFLNDEAALTQAVENHAVGPLGLFNTYGLSFLVLVPIILLISRKKAMGVTIKQTLALLPLRWKHLWWVFGGLAVSFGFSEAWGRFFDATDGDLESLAGTRSYLALAAVVLMAPILEEMFFRGYLFKVLRQTRLGAWGTILLTSLPFTLIHAVQYPWETLVPLFVGAVAFGFVRERTGTLYAPILMHFVNNLIAGLFLLGFVG